MTGLASAAVLVAALAGASLPSSPPVTLLRRLRRTTTDPAARRWRTGASLGRGGPGVPPATGVGPVAAATTGTAAAAAAAAGIGGLVTLLATGSVAGCGALAMATAGAAYVLRLRRRRRSAARWRTLVIELAEAMSAELRAGASARDALAAATQGAVELAPLAAAASTVHGDVVATLRALAEAPGARALRRMEVCWVVCEGSGSSLAGPVARLSAALRDDEQVRREVAAQLAGPRSTGVLLATLPMFGIVMGSAMGAHPLHLLLGTQLGLACLLAGSVLDGLGLIWLARITQRAEPA